MSSTFFRIQKFPMKFFHGILRNDCLFSEIIWNLQKVRLLLAIDMSSHTRRTEYTFCSFCEGLVMLSLMKNNTEAPSLTLCQFPFRDMVHWDRINNIRRGMFYVAGVDIRIVGCFGRVAKSRVVVLAAIKRKRRDFMVWVEKLRWDISVVAASTSNSIHEVNCVFKTK